MHRKRITQTIETLLMQQNVVGLVEVSVAIVGDRKMRKLNKKYRNKDETTNVLSFPLSQGEAIAPSGARDKDVLRLGDIIMSYPQVIREAAKEEKLVDDKVSELVTHSMLHLLGIHHE